MNYLPNLDPELHDGVYVFTTVPLSANTAGLDVVATMREQEGLTLVLPEMQAKQRGFDLAFRCAWITLRVDSALEAVGLTAALARALADESIACNVIAGTHHDHLFVPVARAADALQCLRDLQRRAAGN
ncbi:MAG: hypothetical protein ACI89X_004754 [Planctomycetota bacterium]|jgi:hypothetical protein